MPPHTWMYWLGLGGLGLVLGAFGTLIGAGGGFILMPVLVLLFPDEPPDLLASISLAVVFFNAASGSVGYAAQRKIDYRAGLIFATAAVPGAVLGAMTTGLLPRRAFDLMLGVLMAAAALFLAFSGTRRAVRISAEHADSPGPEGAAEAVFNDDEDEDEVATDHDRAQTPATRRPPRIAYQLERGAAISFGVGYVASLLGIGGGIIHVPALVLLLRFPVHVATATSHFVLALTALAGTLVHVSSGAFSHGWRRTAALSVGVVLGAQLGARLARHAPPKLIIRGLAIAIAIVGVRIVYAALRAR